MRLVASVCLCSLSNLQTSILDILCVWVVIINQWRFWRLKNNVICKVRGLPGLNNTTPTFVLQVPTANKVSEKSNIRKRENAAPVLPT